MKRSCSRTRKRFGLAAQRTNSDFEDLIFIPQLSGAILAMINLTAALLLSPARVFKRSRLARCVSLAFSIGVLLCALPVPAAAYTDPGSVGLVIQVVLAGVAGTLFGIQKFLRRILGKYKQNHGDDNQGA
jgi:hypothetical protein